MCMYRYYRSVVLYFNCKNHTYIGISTTSSVSYVADSRKIVVIETAKLYEAHKISDLYFIS